jgi:xylulose-5-phosphate/fructose-6-phosphate phosphoketolase
MDNKEIISLFTGYGYQARVVEDLDDIDTDVANSMEWALGEIRKIQQAARSGNPIIKPRWPVLILRTPKGWSGPKKVDGEFIEGSFRSHQVPLTKAKTDEGHLKQLHEWLSSYRPEELLKDGEPIQTILDIIPAVKKLGQIKESYAPDVHMSLPDWKKFGVAKGNEDSSMLISGKFLNQVIIDNPTNMRIFSPDELESNKLSAVFESTGRNMQWDQFSRNQGGRVIEMLSENTLQGMLQGYTMTGRTGLFPSYESFLGIIHTMMVQYSKFGKMANEVKWRGKLSSINYIETSTWTRQEHNGFSHQNPSFIGAVLNLKPSAARVYLPPDANCFLSTLGHCLNSKGYVNLMVGSKQPSVVYLTPDEAEAHCRAGASVWSFASTDGGSDPDIVLVGIGLEATFEVLKAAELLRALAPELRVRVVNVTDLMVLGTEGTHPHALSTADFDAMFTADRPIHFNYHGYTAELKGLLFGRPQTDRISLEGYREEGSTTTPLDMLMLNHVSRYDVAEYALRGGARHNEKVKSNLSRYLAEITEQAAKVKEFVTREGKDVDDAYDVPQFEGLVNVNVEKGAGNQVMYEG